MNLSFQAFYKNPKMFHKNIQRAFILKGHSKMDIDIFEDTDKLIIYDDDLI